MGRPPKPRAEVKSVQLGIKMTEGDRKLLDDLVANENQRLRQMGSLAVVSISQVLAWLIRVECAKREIIPREAADFVSREFPDPYVQPQGEAKGAKKRSG